MKTVSRLFLFGIAMSTAAVHSVLGQAPPTLTGQLYMGLTITGEVGQAYLIESATSLAQADWASLAIFDLPSSPYLWMDTNNPATGRRFYRVELPFTPLVFLPPGPFMMGSPSSEAERGSDETQHEVTLAKGVWMGKYEVTQGEYVDVMGSNPSYFRNGQVPYSSGNGGNVTNELRHPVEMVSWNDATHYCAKLTQRELGAGRIPGGWRYRLPTESEWEYGCRGRTTNAFHYGKALRSGMANFFGLLEYDSSAGSIINLAGVFLGRTSDVGSYAPNAFGLYDMHGNVWEWCQDWYGTYPATVTNLAGPASGSYRVIRGGSWGDYAFRSRSALRNYGYPGFRDFTLGFRVVLATGQ